MASNTRIRILVQGASGNTDNVRFDNIEVSYVTNDAPVNTVPVAQSVDEDTALVFSFANGNQISIDDPDAGANPVEVTLSVTNGTLTLNGTTGLTFNTGDGTADATTTFSGTVTDINTALNGLSYSPTTDYNGSETLTLSTLDSTLASLNFDTRSHGSLHLRQHQCRR